MKLNGRILVMAEDATILKQQLDGQDYQEIPALHYGVNTDAMISGRACTLGYTPEILGPYFLENFKETVRLSSVKEGGFQVIVGGDAYGTGSSREAAVVASMSSHHRLFLPPLSGLISESLFHAHSKLAKVRAETISHRKKDMESP